MTYPIVNRSLDAVSREGLTERAAAALRAYIVVNRLAPGTRLPAGPVLASARFDSQSLLCVVLSGDARLLDKLRRDAQ